VTAPVPFRLEPGVVAPVQQSQTTCGPACLLVARMCVDPVFAHWVTTGDRGGRAFPDGPDASARAGAYERLVHRRTTAFTGPDGRLHLPWPRALGTPPWGVCRELESVAGAGTRYRTVVVRALAPQGRARILRALADHVAADRPGVLYVGSSSLPRHVGLLVSSGAGMAVYDPGDGSVRDLDVTALATDRFKVGGWPVPWFVIGPVA
jgi:hypothetical protein